VRHLDLTEIVRADLKSIRRYSQRTWGPDHGSVHVGSARYHERTPRRAPSPAATATTSDLACRWLPVAATACSSKPTSHASLSSVCSTTGWTTSVTSKLTPGLTGTGESTQAARLSPSTARNQGTTRFQLPKF